MRMNLFCLYFLLIPALFLTGCKDNNSSITGQVRIKDAYHNVKEIPYEKIYLVPVTDVTKRYYANYNDEKKKFLEALDSYEDAVSNDHNSKAPFAFRYSTVKLKEALTQQLALVEAARKPEIYFADALVVETDIEGRFSKEVQADTSYYAVALIKNGETMCIWFVLLPNLQEEVVLDEKNAFFMESL